MTVGVIAIDGPAGTGKSTVSKLLADQVGAHYLDTGAMYRAATLAVLRAGVSPADSAAAAAVVDAADIAVDRDAAGVRCVFLDGADVSGPIRDDEVTDAVSAVSAIATVRAKLVDLQRRQAESDLVVVEGRDIGTVVFPDMERPGEDGVAW